MRLLSAVRPLLMRAMCTMSLATAVRNPLLADWGKTEPYGLPPFGRIQPEHFKPAFLAGMDHQLQELRGIVDNPEPPTFDNTIAAFDRCGGVLGQTGAVFSNLCSSNSPPELQAVQLEMAPLLAAHRSRVSTYPGLFARVATAYEGSLDDITLTTEQRRLVERIHLDFVRSGAKFDAAAQKRYAEIMERLSTLQTQFQQNVMADESDVVIELVRVDLDGCPDFLVSAARSAAAEKGKADDCYVITLSRSLVEPFLTFSPRRDLREKAWRLWTDRGQLDPTRDNHAISKEILQLRVEQAALHGYDSFAAYQNADSMAQTPARVMELLERVWEPACAAACAERAELEAFLGEAVEPWDWRFCAEKVRLQKYAFDESGLKPFLSLPAMQCALFSTAERLFGLRFVRVDLTAHGIELYHPDVELYEVREGGAGGADGEADAGGRLVALFLHDNYARANKQSGAWMSEFRSQSRNWNGYDFVPDESCELCGVAITGRATSTERVPIVINNNNFAKGGGETPCLLSFDDALTLFHEMGHGLHAMLSSVTYSRLSGTSVLRDFVELPSQLYAACPPPKKKEKSNGPPLDSAPRSSGSLVHRPSPCPCADRLEHWLRSTDVVLREHATHYATGERIDAGTLARLSAARNFNEGFATVEYTICALLDQALHTLPKEEVDRLDINAFERAELERLNMPQGIVMRHRPFHFQHLFASSGYAAAYYVYLWAEVLDADAFDTFLESGDVFDPSTSRRLRKWIYSSGNSVEPSEAYRNFKGRDPTVTPMLKKKGLLAEV